MSEAASGPSPIGTPPSPPRRHPPRPPGHRAAPTAEVPDVQAGLTAAEREAVVAVTAAGLAAVQLAWAVGQ